MSYLVFLNASVPATLSLLIQGFDEYMNIVLDEAAEVNTKTNASTPIGKTDIQRDGSYQVAADSRPVCRMSSPSPSLSL